MTADMSMDDTASSANANANARGAGAGTGACAVTDAVTDADADPRAHRVIIRRVIKGASTPWPFNVKPSFVCKPFGSESPSPSPSPSGAAEAAAAALAVLTLEDIPKYVYVRENAKRTAQQKQPLSQGRSRSRTRKHDDAWMRSVMTTRSCSYTTPAPHFSQAACAELKRRMQRPSPQPLDLIVRDCVRTFGKKWVTLEAVHMVARHHGYSMSPYRPWVLYTCSRTFERAHILGDMPWGVHFPYFVMSSHSASQECMFRLSEAFWPYINN